VPGPHPATAATRLAVRRALQECSPGDLLLVAVSGGADSLALAAAVAFEAPGLALRAGAVVVDHALQPGSAEVAQRAARVCRQLGLDPVEVATVEVGPGVGGLESAARSARYAALDEAAGRQGAARVLLGHTLDDQAEQVLLGLVRGAGGRSLAGMPRTRGHYLRPLLGVTRDQTRDSCRAEGLEWWDDPMNEDAAYTRVRARRALLDLERDLGPGVTAALARTADQLREDADLLDALADEAVTALLPAAAAPLSPRVDVSAPVSSGASTSNPVAVGVDAMLAVPRPVRTRVWRRLAVAAGSPAGQLGTRHTDACDALLTRWHGQGPVSLPGGLDATRSGGRVSIAAPPPVE
jgi:tRNA(Ile)-lysidine synthase